MKECEVYLGEADSRCGPDPDAADELIAQNPEFRWSIERRRQQAAAGEAKSLAEMREQYAHA